MKLHDLPPYLRPREKLNQKGLDGLSDAELLAIVLRAGYHGKNAVELSQRILSKYSLSELLHLEYSQLKKLKGIGPTKAATLVAIQGMIARQNPVSATQPLISNPVEVLPLLDFLKKKKQEHLVAFYLNARYQIITHEIITIGTLDSSLVHPREVFAPALEYRAAHLILAHNHPSGDPQPSDADITSTEQLVEAGELLDIRVLDHIIVAESGWRSLKQLNLL